jgi:hypothetical protein
MSKGAYEQAEDGEWITPNHNNYRQQCCDCGLVHRYRFRVVDGAVTFQVWRDNRSTAQVRRRLRAAR